MPAHSSSLKYRWILRLFDRHFRIKTAGAPAVLALVLLIIARTSGAQTGRENRASATVQPRPRLVLLIVVDQFRYDYLTRFGDLFSPRGIGRLMREGASWADANYDHFPTLTAPGHSILMTGAWPSQTGIVANDWFEQNTGKKVSSVTDDDTLMLAGRPGAKGKSPRRLLCSSIGDELRIASNDRSKVIGIASKDRSAILPAGRRANAAYWMSIDTGNMVSSTFYTRTLPEWVTRFNARRMADKWFGRSWERLLPQESEYLKRAGKDDVPWENQDKSSNDTNFFPHVINGGAKEPNRAFYRALDFSPFSNELLVAFAEEAITNERLGQDNDADFLSISFSGNDYVGHRFGPYSQESMDMALRVDRQISTLLDFIDGRVGLRNTLVVFTADHGVSPIPEHAAAMNLPGRRFQKSDLFDLVQTGLQARYARADRPANDYIRNFTNREETESGLINNNFYLNRAALKRDGIDPAECEHVIGELAMQLPGLARYFTREQLQSKSISMSDPIGRRVLNGFYPQRSGDVIVVFEPYNILFGLPDDPTEPRASDTHGSPYNYDTHVPLIIMGRDFSPRSYSQAVTPADIAPTLARVLGIQAPGCSIGRILAEGLAHSN